MKPQPACIPCVLHQALQVARAASDDEWSQRKVLNEVLRVLPETDWNQTPADLLEDAFAEARDTLRVHEPFAERRAHINKVFEHYATAFRGRLDAADDRLALAATAAAAANLVDELVFARFSRQEDPKAIFEACLEAGFAAGSVDQLREALADAKSVLYLLDNAGEVFFDALLIEELERMDLKVRVVVRGGSLLHDATVEDALAAGLGKPVPTESEEAAALAPAAPNPEDSSDDPTAAADPNQANPEAEADCGQPDQPEPETLVAELIELKPGQLGVSRVAKSTSLGAALEASDVVIAKGSAFYETFVAEDQEVIYLLRAKCVPVAQSLGVTPGSLVLHRVPRQKTAEA